MTIWSTSTDHLCLYPQPSGPTWLRNPDHDYIFMSVNTLPNPPRKIPSWLRNLLGDDFFAAIVRVSFDRVQVTDAGLEHVKGLTQLQWLFLFSSREITDAGLEHLKELTQLQELWLDSAKVTGAGLEHLKGLPHLQVLDLWRHQGHGQWGVGTPQRFDPTRSVDAKTTTGHGRWIGTPQRFDPTLEWLFLSNTKVTDAGLERLKGLTHLQELWLDGTKVTDAGVTKLSAGIAELPYRHFACRA